ncbi:MAG: hypothetical protein PWR10_1936 [Halanaerobiales bacterium]|nr:hypothetical protein [Halanaerobiales bacterium]
MRKEKEPEKYIPGKDEIEEETNNEIHVQDSPKLKTGEVNFPGVEDEIMMSEFEANAAQQVGRFSDQVMLGSPAAEAGTIGQDNLKKIVEASKRKLAKKLNDNDEQDE